MSASKAKRGRPKGSGINDASILSDIAALIAADPEMKPTTAIKTLGYHDPSTIRRLRDKYKDYRIENQKTEPPEHHGIKGHDHSLSRS
ncbi:MAG: hypothetical protein AAFO75_00665, partial [Pseudomonadota bacterium]